MNLYSFVLLTFFFLNAFSGISQSKKEQIDILIQQRDSLNRVIQMKNTEINALNEQLLQINQINDQQREKLSALETKLNELSITQSVMLKKIDSLQMVQQSLSPFSTKRQILSKLVGVYYFERADGFSGANTLTEIFKDGQGGYFGESSTLEGGMREVYEREIDSRTENFLREFRIEVDSLLNVKLRNGSSTVFTVPFTENGMVYNVNEVGKELHEHLKEINSSTIFFEDRLYIVAKNEVYLSNLIPDQLGLIGEDVMILSYSLFDGQFLLEFFYNDCCDNNTFTFKRL